MTLTWWPCHEIVSITSHYMQGAWSSKQNLVLTFINLGLTTLFTYFGPCNSSVKNANLLRAHACERGFTHHIQNKQKITQISRAWAQLIFVPISSLWAWTCNVDRCWSHHQYHSQFPKQVIRRPICSIYMVQISQQPVDLYLIDPLGRSMTLGRIHSWIVWTFIQL